MARLNSFEDLDKYKESIVADGVSADTKPAEKQKEAGVKKKIDPKKRERERAWVKKHKEAQLDATPDTLPEGVYYEGENSRKGTRFGQEYSVGKQQVITSANIGWLGFDLHTDERSNLGLRPAQKKGLKEQRNDLIRIKEEQERNTQKRSMKDDSVDNLLEHPNIKEIFEYDVSGYENDPELDTKTPEENVSKLSNPVPYAEIEGRKARLQQEILKGTAYDKQRFLSDFRGVKNMPRPKPLDQTALVKEKKDARKPAQKQEEDSVWDISKVTPAMHEVARLAERYAVQAAQAEKSGEFAKAERIRATVNMMRREVINSMDANDKLENKIKTAATKNEKKVERAQKDEVEKKKSEIIKKFTPKKETTPKPVSVMSEREKIRELKGSLAKLAQIEKEALNAATAYDEAKKARGFLSRLFKGKELEARRAEAKRLRDVYEKTALATNEAIFTAKRKELTDAVHTGKIDMAEAKRQLRVYAQEEIVPLIESEKKERAKMDTLLK